MESKRMTAQYIADSIVDEIRQDLLKGDYDVASRRITKALTDFGNQRAEEAVKKAVLTMSNNDGIAIARKSALENVINLIKDKINQSWDIPHELIDEIQALIDKKEGV